MLGCVRLVSVWISGVLDDVFAADLSGLVGLPVYPERLSSLQYAGASVCRLHGRIVVILKIFISQGSVATQLRCGGIF